MLNFPILCDLFPFSMFYCPKEGKMFKNLIIAAAASEPEANERGSSLISRRLHYRGLQSLFLTNFLTDFPISDHGHGNGGKQRG